jgi:hypothetical protein
MAEDVPKSGGGEVLEACASRQDHPHNARWRGRRRRAGSMRTGDAPGPAGELAVRPRCSHLRGAGGHPQDQARDHHHAGEPVLRQLLRYLSGGRRLPHARGCASRLRAGPQRRMHPALPRHRRRQWRRSACRAQCGGRRRPRQDGRLHPAARRGAESLRLAYRPGMRGLRSARRDGLPHGSGDTKLLDLRPRLRAQRSHVRAGEVVVTARPPVHGLRLVGQVPQPLADELRQQRRRTLRRQAVRAGRGSGSADRQDVHRPCLDRYHLALVCPPR